MQIVEGLLSPPLLLEPLAEAWATPVCGKPLLRHVVGLSYEKSIPTLCCCEVASEPPNWCTHTIISMYVHARMPEDSTVKGYGRTRLPCIAGLCPEFVRCVM
eukprot:scaffold311771_cov41-Tisochrysis_lutea.AAC.1